MSFHFRGVIPSSKSILNRLLVIQSYSQDGLKIIGESDADDVVRMRNGLRQLLRGEIADCGAAGTTLRFLALRASRLQGSHHLSGSLRLFERPQAELEKLLTQVGVEVEIRTQRLTVRGEGWSEPNGEITIDRSISSQFASSVFLNAWGLPFDLRVVFSGDRVSESYFLMTLELLRRAGMTIHEDQGAYVVPAGQNIKARELVAEPDASSAFAIAAVGVARKGVVEIEAWPSNSLQPDSVFPSLLAKMGCDVDVSSPVLKVRGVSHLKPLEFSLREAPDLFPVLAVLCAFADGRSRLYGAPHLAHKESDRIAKVAELLRSLDRNVRVLEDGLEIEGRLDLPTRPFRYATDHDHRLAMAGAVARAFGAPIEILDERVVEKSYPAFWSAIENAGGF